MSPQIRWGRMAFARCCLAESGTETLRALRSLQDFRRRSWYAFLSPPLEASPAFKRALPGALQCSPGGRSGVNRPSVNDRCFSSFGFVVTRLFLCDTANKQDNLAQFRACSNFISCSRHKAASEGDVAMGLFDVATKRHCNTMPFQRRSRAIHPGPAQRPRIRLVRIRSTWPCPGSVPAFDFC